MGLLHPFVLLTSRSRNRIVIIFVDNLFLIVVYPYDFKSYKGHKGLKILVARRCFEGVTILAGSFTGLKTQTEFTERTDYLGTELCGDDRALNIFTLLPFELNSGL